ncbi:hypothetical protein Hanom_Chr00s000007g01615031 [Helianthus anomalus]
MAIIQRLGVRSTAATSHKFWSLGLCRTWFKPTQPGTRTKTGKQLPLDAYRFFIEKMINLICIMLTKTMLTMLCFWRLSFMH